MSFICWLLVSLRSSLLDRLLFSPFPSFRSLSPAHWRSTTQLLQRFFLWKCRLFHRSGPCQRTESSQALKRLAIPSAIALSRDISGNDLTELPPDIFDSLTSLRFLYALRVLLMQTYLFFFLSRMIRVCCESFAKWINKPKMVTFFFRYLPSAQIRWPWSSEECPSLVPSVIFYKSLRPKPLMLAVSVGCCFLQRSVRERAGSAIIRDLRLLDVAGLSVCIYFLILFSKGML